MISDRIHRARKGAGLSLRELSDRVDVSHAMIKKYEDGITYPSSDILIKIAKALNVRTEYFFRPEITPKLGEIKYRLHSAIPKKELSIINQKIDEHIERRIELETLFPKASKKVNLKIRNLPEKIKKLVEIEKIAEKVRGVWKLGLDPILDLVDIFEMNGIRVFSINTLDHPKFDGLSTQRLSKPFIVISNNWPGDRQRFTLAHELGHFILEERLHSSLNEEEACNRFAAAFLFPVDSVVNIFGDNRNSIELKELSLIKEEYGVSMGCILHRLRELEIINEYYFSQTQKLFKNKGWNITEPGNAYPREKTHVFEQMVYHALAEDCIGESKAAELLSYNIREFRRIRKMEPTFSLA